MRVFSIFLSALFFLLTGCSDNNQEHAAGNLPAVDSMTLANQVYVNGMVDLSASKNISEILCQGWELDDDIETIRNNADAEGIYPFRSFYLAADSTVVKNPRNAMEYGYWSYNAAEKKILIKTNESKDVYKIAAIGPTELIVVNTGIGSLTNLKFLAAGKIHRDKLSDPYYIANNRWRIRPRASESDLAIRKRLKDCLHFYILFYKDNLAKQQKWISFYGFPTCLKWYSGGIYMVKEQDLEDNWFRCFYNREEAMKAYHMMEDIISKKYTWSKEKMSWVKKNLLVLEQMYNNL